MVAGAEFDQTDAYTRQHHHEHALHDLVPLQLRGQIGDARPLLDDGDHVHPDRDECQDRLREEYVRQVLQVQVLLQVQCVQGVIEVHECTEYEADVDQHVQHIVETILAGLLPVPEQEQGAGARQQHHQDVHGGEHSERGQWRIVTALTIVINVGADTTKVIVFETNLEIHTVVISEESALVLQRPT